MTAKSANLKIYDMSFEVFFNPSVSVIHRYNISTAIGGAMSPDESFADIASPIEIASIMILPIPGSLYHRIEIYTHYHTYRFSNKTYHIADSNHNKWKKYGNDNTMNTSRSVSVGKTYKGQIAANDEKDFYKFSIESSGRITIDFEAYISDLKFWVYNEEGDCIYDKGGSWYSEYFHWDSVTCKIEQDIELDLTKGTYYVCFGKCTTGNYSFTVKTPFAGKPVSINRSSATLGVGETITVKANQNVSWKSSNPSLPRWTGVPCG